MEKPDRPAILVVDDLPANVTLLTGILNPYYQIRTARDGIMALESADRDPPDLILLDVMMPGIDGYEVCRRLKENPKTRKIPVLFVTAKSEDVDETKGFEVGAMDYIAKPVRLRVVLARVKTHLSLATALRELEKQNATLQEIIHLREDIERLTQHDLKSPLTAFINIPPMLMRDENQTPDQIEMLEILHKSGFRMLEMINRSLDLFKMERGKYRFNPVPVDVVKIVRDILSEFGSLASAKKIEIRLLIDSSLATDTSMCFFPGEEFLYFSMLSNLIKNALEASPEGQEIIINLRSLGGCSIEVRNQGEIPFAIRGNFLEKYVTHGKIGGTGLGVYSARLMAKTLGGELCFHSTKETGTLLTIEIPREQKQAPQPASPDLTVSPFQKARSAMRVLVVDDYGYMRKIIGDILRQMGFGHVLEAADVPQAQSFLELSPVDLIISDLTMPEETGLDLLRAVRSRADGATVPFFIITGNSTEEIIALARKNGVTDFLAKPFSPDTLKNRIDALFGEKETSRNEGAKDENSDR